MSRTWHRWLSRTVAGAAMLVAALLMAGQLGLLAGSPPDDLGVTDGRLKPPSLTENSVSSQARLYPEHPQGDYATIAPLMPRDGETAATAMKRLTVLLTELPGIAVSVSDEHYIRAEARTPWLGFVDDMEFWFNQETGIIELRSASRLGRKDFGVNRSRIETVRAAFEG
ncbi:DUF1499 domain-containing protein [Hydrogenophaga sp. 5NK40-0174]|uniref:DUF1499 domain-containing protein n=1 Tax=Hydrogenophaga sp. 5NK40-0174 TaxID=3127649 RepID=UPI00310BFC99